MTWFLVGLALGLTFLAVFAWATVRLGKLADLTTIHKLD